MADPRRPQVPTRPAPPKGRPTVPANSASNRPVPNAKRSRPPTGGTAKPASARPRPQKKAKTRLPLARTSTPQAKAGPLARAASSVSRPPHRPVLGSPTPATPWERVSATGSDVTTRLQERLRERRSAQTRLTALTWAKRLGIAAAAGGAVWLVALSPVFGLDPESIEASGFGSVVSEEQVNEVIAAHEGTSLVMLDTGDLTAELEQLVGVREVEITRVWPAGLRVEIVSSEPVAAIPQGSAFLLVDDRGETVNTAQSAPTQLPVITIPVGAESSRILDGVLDVVDEIPVALRDRVEGIEAKTEDSISFVLRDGPRVEWGSGEQSALKAEVLQALLGSRQTDGVDVIDVSAPSLPITNRE